MFGLSLFDVEQLKVHGGSNRYWLKKLASDSIIEPSVERLVKLEIESGLFNPSEWATFSGKVSGILTNFHKWLLLGEKSSLRIYGYGAAAKASTILNSIDATPNLVKAIADLSLEKQGRFMPPHGISIISPQELFIQKPTDIVIFPWNIKSEIATFLQANLGDRVRIWCAVPKMHQVEVQ